MSVTDLSKVARPEDQNQNLILGHVYLFVQTDIAVIILVTVKEIKLDSRFWFKGDIICESQASV